MTDHHEKTKTIATRLRPRSEEAAKILADAGLPQEAIDEALGYVLDDAAHFFELDELDRADDDAAELAKTAGTWFLEVVQVQLEDELEARERVRRPETWCKPLAVVRRRSTGRPVEVTCYPTPGGQVYARTELGRAWSAEYIAASDLEPIPSETAKVELEAQARSAQQDEDRIMEEAKRRVRDRVDLVDHVKAQIERDPEAYANRAKLEAVAPKILEDLGTISTTELEALADSDPELDTIGGA